MIKFAFEKLSVSRVGVTLKGDIQTKALNFLKIFNNVRDNNELLHVYNDHADNVYVICEDDSVDATVEWLGWFGEVHEPEHVNGIRPALIDHLLTDAEFDSDICLIPAELPW